MLQASGSPAELEAILARDWPYLDSYLEEVEQCLSGDCARVSGVIERLGNHHVCPKIFTICRNNTSRSNLFSSPDHQDWEENFLSADPALSAACSSWCRLLWVSRRWRSWKNWGSREPCLSRVQSHAAGPQACVSQDRDREGGAAHQDGPWPPTPLLRPSAKGGWQRRSSILWGLSISAHLGLDKIGGPGLVRADRSEENGGDQELSCPGWAGQGLQWPKLWGLQGACFPQIDPWEVLLPSLDP